ncbi:MAG: phosphomannomutase, partial [Oscillibacter sp.]
MDYRKEYEKWLESPAVSEADKAELRGLSEKEIESRFYGPLEFG